MRTFMNILSVAMMAMLVVCGCQKQDSAASASKTFTVGFDAEFPPYGFRAEDGSFKGFDLDLAREVAKRNGWAINLKAIDWAAKDAELKAGTIDCIWNGFTMTDERLDKYTWSAPYVQNKQLLLVRANSGLKTLADLNGKVIAAQDGSSGAEAIETAIEAIKKENAAFAIKELRKTKDYLTAKAFLESGAVDAVALDSAVANGFIEKNPNVFVAFDKPLKLENYAIGFNLGNTELRDTVEKTLREMVKDGTAAAILQNWKENEAANGGNAIDFILEP